MRSPRTPHRRSASDTEESPRLSRRTHRIRLGERDVVMRGVARPLWGDLYHFFMTVSWPLLFGTFAAFFLSFDLLFGELYHLVPGCIANLNPPGFAGEFFFSVETLATVGYGEMYPQTFYGHFVAMLEIFVGLMALALITGIMFARFSRPRARFLFARRAVVRPIDGKLTLMFRAANARHNVVQEASAQLRMLRTVETAEGYRVRRIIDLPLVRAQHPVFVLSWNIMHVIDETSPLSGENAETLVAAGSTFVLSLSGTDETTGQVLMARREYSSPAIIWNAAFVDVLEVGADGSLAVDYARFHEVQPLSTAERGSETR